MGGGGGGKEAVNKLCGAIPYHVSRITFKLSLLILRCSFKWCRQIFPNWSMSKVEKTVEEAALQPEEGLQQPRSQGSVLLERKGRVGEVKLGTRLSLELRK